MANTRTQIIVKQGQTLLGQYELAPGRYIIGSDPACDIRIQATTVAGQHARLTYDGEQIEVEDLGSQTGTLLAGKRLQQPAQLDENGVLHLGDVTVEIRSSPAELPTLPSANRPAAADDATLPPSGKSDQPPPVQLTKSRERVYEVGGEVARGGMGAVLRAKDLNIERTVAMKIVLDHRADDDDLVQRFQQEAKITGQLEHPNIVPVHDLAFDEQGHPFYTMKFVKGVTLQAVLEKIKDGDAATLTRYSLTQLLTIFQKVCDAVAYAHSKGVVHRDLKPPNIMVGDYGEVLVMDWGLAKVVSEQRPEVSGQPEAASHQPVLQSSVIAPQSAELTLAGTVMGSPQFMAPEQAAGKLDEIDARTDIFALGGILYNILTLHTTVSGDSIAEMLRKIREGEILPPTSYNSKTGRKKAGTIKVGNKTFPYPPLIPLRHCPGGRIPESLAAVAMKALALRRDDRYPNVPELQADIAAYQGGFATGAENAGMAKQLWLLVKRHKREFIIAHAALLLLVGGTVLFMVKVTKEKTRAEKTLVALHGTAPTFYEQATTLIGQRKLPEALEKISFAVSLAPEVVEYHVLQGNILQTLLRMPEACEAYAAALQRQPDHKLAKENLAICQTFLREEAGRQVYQPASLNRVLTALKQQGRLAEAVVFAERFVTDRISTRNALSNLLAQAGISGNLVYDNAGLRFTMTESSASVYTNDSLSPFQGMPLSSLGLTYARAIRDLRPLQGMPLQRLQLTSALVSDLSPLQGMQLRELNLNPCDKITDITPLKGMPLEKLGIASSQVSDIGVLQGMPLTDLHLGSTKVADLTPLAGMRLIRLFIDGTKVADLSPLRGMPLKYLNASGTGIHDLSPLKGMPLEVLLLIGNTSVKDLSPLQGMPLTSLTLIRTSIDDLTPLKGLPLKKLSLAITPVTDLSPLRGMPLQDLDLADCAKLQDLTPLVDCSQLEFLAIPTTCKDIECLRSLPKLKQLRFTSRADSNTPPTVAEFWKQYDAKKTKASAGKPTP